MRSDTSTGGYEYVGRGPAATGPGGGWNMQSWVFARCGTCGDFVSLDPTTYGGCTCGALSKDPDAGRIGSSLGDDAIEVYRRTA